MPATHGPVGTPGPTMLDDPPARPPSLEEDPAPPGPHAPEVAPASAADAAPPSAGDGPAAAVAAGDAAPRAGPWWRRRALLSFAAQVGVLWVLTWPAASLSPLPGLDPSYRWSLQQAYVEGRRFGADIAFTYGPLGFLSFPELYFTRPTFLSLATRSLVMLAGCAVVLALARRAVRRPVLALLASYLVVCLTLGTLMAETGLAESVSALLVAGGVGLLVAGADLGPRPRVALLVGLGAVAALLLLVKLNWGVTALLAGAAAAVALQPGRAWAPRRRLADLATFAVATTAAFLLGWLATGQRLGDLGPYVRSSRELTSGYSSAMSFEGGANRWEYAAAAALVGFAAAALVALARGARRDGPRPAEAAAPAPAGTAGRSNRAAGLVLASLPALVFAVAAFAAFKHGFVRHDAHSQRFFAGMAVMLLGLASRRTAAVVAGGVALALVASLSMTNLDVAATLDPRRHLDDLRFQAHVLRDPAARDRLRQEARDRLAAEYALDPTSLELLAGRRVHVDPWETSVLFAHPIADWAPPPVFQAYSAYTAQLDERNAAALVAPDGPEVVLREVQAIDGRNPAWESPAYVLTLVCHFRAVHAQPRWTVLERGPGRCGPPRVVTQVTARAGDEVELPRPSDCAGVLTVRVDGVLGSPAERALDLLYKANMYAFEVAGAGYYRFVALTASQPHVLWVPGDPAWLGGHLDLRRGGRVSVQPVPSLDAFDQVGTDDVLRYSFECTPYRAEP